jgi:maleylacetate reductase
MARAIAMAGPGVGVGASHAIGHVLGGRSGVHTTTRCRARRTSATAAPAARFRQSPRDFLTIAEKVRHDFTIRSNPRPVTVPQEVIDILNLAW